MLALTPIIAVIGGSLMLELSIPILTSLTEVPGRIDPQAAMAFFLLGAVHVALMLMAFKISGSMVAGWRVFGLVPVRDTATPAVTTVNNQPIELPRQVPQSNLQPSVGSRRVDVLGAVNVSAANDAGPASTRVTRTNVYANASSHENDDHGRSPVSRTRGIGNRFRPMRKHPTEVVS